LEQIDNHKNIIFEPERRASRQMLIFSMVEYQRKTIFALKNRLVKRLS